MGQSNDTKMRWIKFDSSVNGVFSRDVCQEDGEYLGSHFDTFKCMWQEQTRAYWIRLVISLREYIYSHVYSYAFLQKFPTGQDVVKGVVDNTMMDICDKFVFGGYGVAKELIVSIMFVMANKDHMAQIGSRSIANDPFYNRSTKNAFRTVFGTPASVDKIQFHAHLTVNLFSRFASAVVSILRCWVNEPDCTLLNFYTLYLRDPYWRLQVDWCPQDPLYKYLDSKFFFWSAPDFDELKVVIEKAPDRASGFREVASLVPSYEDYADFGDSDEYDNLLFAISDQLAEADDDIHDGEACPMCEMKQTFMDTANQLRREILHRKAEEEFWLQRKMVALLIAAEEKFKLIAREKGLEHKLLNVPPPPTPKKKKNKKKKKGRSGADNNVKPSPISRVAIEDSAEAKAMVAKAIACLKQVNLGDKAGTTMDTMMNGVATNGVTAKTSPVKVVATKVAEAAVNGTTKCCAHCKKREGCKLKRCSLCVQKGVVPPAYYCSRKCQMDNWEEEHQYVHADDLEDTE